jgi:ABC-type phosphate transport system ATPase subunit
MVCQSATIGYYTTPIKMKKPEIANLNLHYGNDFTLLHDVLRDILQVKDSTGITMFHGPPGTGKTNYLRYLINEIQGKNIIYIPPDLVNVSLFRGNSLY